MSKYFVMTFSVPVSDDLFAQAKVITAVEQAIDAFKGSLNGMDGYKIMTELLPKRQPKAVLAHDPSLSNGSEVGGAEGNESQASSRRVVARGASA